MPKISKQNGVSQYNQLKDILLEEIDNDVFNKGERFYSEREIVKKFKVGRNTAIEALRILEMQGMLQRIQGRGSFYTGKKKETKKTYNIAALISNDLERIHPAGLATMHVVEQIIKREDYNLLLVSIDEDSSQEDAQSFLAKNKADAYILWGVSGEIHHLFHPKSIPAIVMGDTLSRKLPTVRTDHFMIINEEVNYLLDSGHRKIGMLAIDSKNIGVMMGQRGYEIAYKMKKLPYRESFLFLDAESPEDIIDATEKLVKKGVTALIYDGVEMYDHGILAINKMRKKVPEDISVLVTEKPKLFRDVYPDLTGFEVDQKKLGEATGEMILKVIKGIKVEDKIIESHFFKGSSCS